MSSIETHQMGKKHEPSSEKKPKEVYLPKQYSKYRQLVSEIVSHNQNIYRFNFKQKNKKRTNLLKNDEDEELTYEIARHKQFIKREEKLKQLKDYIMSKQMKAKQIKRQKMSQKKLKVSEELIKWQKTVNNKKNVQAKQEKQSKNAYKRSLSPYERRSNIVKKAAQEQNEYISFVTSPSREISKSKLRLNLQDYPKLQENRFDSPFELKSSKNSKKYFQKLKDFKKTEEEESEKKLQINYEKEKKIAEARQIKKYIQVQRHKVNNEKSNMLKQKFEQNIRRLFHQQKLKQMELEAKFNEKRKKKREGSLPLMRRRFSKNFEEEQNNSVKLLSIDENEEENERNKQQILEKYRSISTILQRNNPQDSVE